MNDEEAAKARKLSYGELESLYIGTREELAGCMARAKDWQTMANDRAARIIELMEANERLRLENESLRQQVRGLKNGKPS